MQDLFGWRKFMEFLTDKKTSCTTKNKAGFDKPAIGFQRSKGTSTRSKMPLRLGFSNRRWALASAFRLSL